MTAGPELLARFQPGTSSSHAILCGGAAGAPERTRMVGSPASTFWTSQCLPSPVGPLPCTAFSVFTFYQFYDQNFYQLLINQFWTASSDWHRQITGKLNLLLYVSFMSFPGCCLIRACLKLVSNFLRTCFKLWSSIEGKGRKMFARSCVDTVLRIVSCNWQFVDFFASLFGLVRVVPLYGRVCGSLWLSPRLSPRLSPLLAMQRSISV